MSRFCKYAVILGLVFVIDHVTGQNNGGPPSMESQQANNMLLKMMGAGDPQSGQRRSNEPQVLQQAQRTGIQQQPANAAQKPINHLGKPINQPKQSTQPDNPFIYPNIASRQPFMPPANANNAGQFMKLFEQIRQLENSRHGEWQRADSQPKMEPDFHGQPWTNSLAQAYMIGRMADNMELEFA
ncbi:uncharacterized protein LOC127856851 [Dreissena polymorpha]|nr:uncharacterized protein LOC127856851 [Dreissena polymorpha]